MRFFTCRASSQDINHQLSTLDASCMQRQSKLVTTGSQTGAQKITSTETLDVYTRVVFFTMSTMSCARVRVPKQEFCLPSRNLYPLRQGMWSRRFVLILCCLVPLSCRGTASSTRCCTVTRTQPMPSVARWRSHPWRCTRWVSCRGLACLMTMRFGFNIMYNGPDLER